MWAEATTAMTRSKYLYENEIMNGTSDTQFSPNAELTRGMVVTILYRMEGEPFTLGSKSFTDVKAGRYYSEAVEWAAENGIVNGFTDGTFKPDQAVTREQLASILRRYASFSGIATYDAELPRTRPSPTGQRRMLHGLTQKAS